MPSIADLFISVSSDVSGAISGLTQVDQRVNGVSASMAAAAPAGYALAGAAGAVGAGFLSAIDTASDFQQHMANVNALLNPNEVNTYSSALTTLAMNLGRDTVFSADQAATAIGELIKAGVDVPTVLNGGASAALNLAAATGTDIPLAASFAGTALNTFHESADQLTHTVDVLTGVANASAASIQSLQFGFASVGPVAASLGLSFDDVATALGVFANNGLAGSDAGTSLRTMLLNLEPSTRSQITAFQQLGLYTIDTGTGVLRLADILQSQGAPGIAALTRASADGVVTMDELFTAANHINPALVEGAQNADAWARAQGLATNAFFDATGAARPMNEIFQILRDSTANLTAETRTNLLATAFGTDAVRAATIAASEGADGFNRLSAQVQVEGLAAQEAATRQNSLEGSLNQMSGSFETLQITVGNLFLPVLRQLVDMLTSVLNGFLLLDPGVQIFIVAATGLTAGVLGLTAAFILLTPVLTATAGAFVVLEAAASPILVPLLAIAAAVALLYAAWQDDFGGIREETQQVWEAIQPAFVNIQNAINAIRETLAPAFANVQSAAGPLIEQISQQLAPLFAQLPGLVRSVGDALNIVGDVIQFLIHGNLDTFLGLMQDGIPPAFIQGLIVVRDAAVTLWNELNILFTGIQNIVGYIQAGDFSGAWRALTDMFGQLQTEVEPLWGEFLTFLDSAFHALQGFVADRIVDMWNALIAEFRALPDILSPLWDAFGGWFYGVLSALPGFVGIAIVDIWQGLIAAFGGLVDLLAPLWDVFAGWFAAVLGGMPQFVIDGIGDIWGGLTTAFGGLIDVLSPLWDQFAGWLESLLSGLPQFVIDHVGDIFGGLVQQAYDLAARIAAAFGAPGGSPGGTPGTPPPPPGGIPGTVGGGGPLVSIGTLIISSQDEANAFLDLVAQAVLASARRVTVPAVGGNPVLG